jgi:hypothetical protein
VNTSNVVTLAGSALAFIAAIMLAFEAQIMPRAIGRFFGQWGDRQKARMRGPGGASWSLGFLLQMLGLVLT